MGKQARLRAARRSQEHRPGRQRESLVMRPFNGLPGEGDWVALREFVPAATARVRLAGEHADRDVTVATVLPAVVPALTRDSGAVLIGVQAAVASTDPSRDLAAALMAALTAEPGTAIESIPAESSPAESIPTGADGGRLQDLVDPAGPFDVAVHDGFDFWIEDADDPTGELAAALERANASVVPTQRLSAVDSAYWCAVRDRNHLRWVMPHAEAPLVDALARLHSAGESSLGDGTRLVGSFRARRHRAGLGSAVGPARRRRRGTSGSVREATRRRTRYGRTADRRRAARPRGPAQPAADAPLTRVSYVGSLVQITTL